MLIDKVLVAERNVSVASLRMVHVGDRHRLPL